MLNYQRVSRSLGHAMHAFPIFKATRIKSPQNLSRGTWHCWKHLHGRVPAMGLCLQRSCGKDNRKTIPNDSSWVLHIWTGGLLMFIVGFEWFYRVLLCFTISFYTDVLWFLMVLPCSTMGPSQSRPATQQRTRELKVTTSRRRAPFHVRWNRSCQAVCHLESSLGLGSVLEKCGINTF